MLINDNLVTRSSQLAFPFLGIYEPKDKRHCSANIHSLSPMLDNGGNCNFISLLLHSWTRNKYLATFICVYNNANTAKCKTESDCKRKAYITQS